VSETANRSAIHLPERHPEERRAPSPSSTAAAAPALPATDAPRLPASSGFLQQPDTSSTHTTGKRSIVSFLRPKKVPLIGGVRLTTLVRVLAQLLFFCGTVAGWVATVMVLNRRTAKDPDGDHSNPFDGSSALVFVHAAFGIATLTQLLFLERIIFRARAERYAHVHPGALLPRTFRIEMSSRGGVGGRRSNDSSLALAPWNRPSLPTYAAALRDGAAGTGDVEDAAIAAPPPPAYGNTRGSQMLLSGFMTTELRQQARAARGSQFSERSERPVSYMSHDSDWIEISDASRARQLEDTLTRLEEGNSSTASVAAAAPPATAHDHTRSGSVDSTATITVRSTPTAQGLFATLSARDPCVH
jgi:hypothetical protein